VLACSFLIEERRYNKQCLSLQAMGDKSAAAAAVAHLYVLLVASSQNSCCLTLPLLLPLLLQASWQCLTKQCSSYWPSLPTTNLRQESATRGR
jgi:hypothetical protein